MQPVVEVDRSFAVCDGGGGVLGHPIQYIQLDVGEGKSPVSCRYCGTRYQMKKDSHGHHH